MSNRSLFEFNHDIDWVKDVERLVFLLQTVRNSIPNGTSARSVSIREELKYKFGITYMGTRHHSDKSVDERISSLEADIAALKLENKRLQRAAKKAETA